MFRAFLYFGQNKALCWASTLDHCVGLVSLGHARSIPHDLGKGLHRLGAQASMSQKSKLKLALGSNFQQFKLLLNRSRPAGLIPEELRVGVLKQRPSLRVGPRHAHRLNHREPHDFEDGRFFVKAREAEPIRAGESSLPSADCQNG